MLGKRKALKQTKLTEEMPRKRPSTDIANKPKTTPTAAAKNAPAVSFSPKRVITPEAIRTAGSNPTRFSSNRTTRLKEMKPFAARALFFFDSPKDKVAGEWASLSATRITACLSHLHILRAVALEKQVPEFEVVWDLWLKEAITNDAKLFDFRLQDLEQFFRKRYAKDSHKFRFRDEDEESSSDDDDDDDGDQDGTLGKRVDDDMSDRNRADGGDAMSESEDSEKEESFSAVWVRLRENTSKAFARNGLFSERIKNYSGFKSSLIGSVYIEMLDWVFRGGCKWLYRMVITVMLMFYKDSEISLYNPRKLSIRGNSSSHRRHKMPIDRAFVEDCDEIPANLKDAIHFISKYVDRIPQVPTGQNSSSASEDCPLLLQALDLDYITAELHSMAVRTYMCFIDTSRMDMILRFIENNFVKRAWGTNDPYTSRSQMVFAIDSFMESCNVEELTAAEKKELNAFQHERKLSGSGGNWKLFPKEGSYAHMCLYGHNGCEPPSGVQPRKKGIEFAAYHAKQGASDGEDDSHEELLEAFESLQLYTESLRKHYEEHLDSLEKKFSSSTRIRGIVTKSRDTMPALGDLSLLPKPIPTGYRKFGSRRSQPNTTEDLSSESSHSTQIGSLSGGDDDDENLATNDAYPADLSLLNDELEGIFAEGRLTKTPSAGEQQLSRDTHSLNDGDDDIPWLSKSPKNADIEHSLIGGDDDNGMGTEIRVRKRRTKISVAKPAIPTS